MKPYTLTPPTLNPTLYPEPAIPYTLPYTPNPVPKPSTLVLWDPADLLPQAGVRGNVGALIIRIGFWAPDSVIIIITLNPINLKE